MFQLSLILGVIQILFGMILKAVNQAIQFGFKYAVATIGWIVLLISCGVGFMLPEVMPLGGTVHLCILGVAAVMIFLFNSPGKNVFMNIGLGLWGFLQHGYGFAGRRAFVCSSICPRSVGRYSCGSIQQSGCGHEP